MHERDNVKVKGEYVPPAMLRLGSSAAITAMQMQLNSDDAQNPDNAFPNPTDAS